MIDLSVPRHAQYLHKAWKRHQNAVYWVDIDLAIRKGLTFYHTPSNASAKENWVQNMLNDQKLGNYLEVSNRTNEHGDLLSRMT